MLKGRNKRISSRKFSVSGQNENKSVRQSINRYISKGPEKGKVWKKKGNVSAKKSSLANLLGSSDTQTKFYPNKKMLGPNWGTQERGNSYNLLHQVDVQGTASSKKGRIRVNIPNKKKVAKDFMFEKIFNENSTQEDVFGTFEKLLIDNSINGVSGQRV
jgi:hypothetical protein